MFVACHRCSSDARGSSDTPGGLGLVELFSKHVGRQLMRLAWGWVKNQCCCLQNVAKRGGKILLLTVDFWQQWRELEWACVCHEVCLKRVSSRECSPNNIASRYFRWETW